MNPKRASTWVELPKPVDPYFLNRKREFLGSFHRCLKYLRHQFSVKTNDTSLNVHQRLLIQTIGSFSANLLGVPPAPPTQSAALVEFHPQTNADTYSMALMILHKSPTQNVLVHTRILKWSHEVDPHTLNSSTSRIPVSGISFLHDIFLERWQALQVVTNFYTSRTW